MLVKSKKNSKQLLNTEDCSKSLNLSMKMSLRLLKLLKTKLLPHQEESLAQHSSKLEEWLNYSIQPESAMPENLPNVSKELVESMPQWQEPEKMHTGLALKTITIWTNTCVSSKHNALEKPNAQPESMKSHRKEENTSEEDSTELIKKSIGPSNILLTEQEKSSTKASKLMLLLQRRFNNLLS